MDDNLNVSIELKGLEDFKAKLEEIEETLSKLDSQLTSLNSTKLVIDYDLKRKSETKGGE